MSRSTLNLQRFDPYKSLQKPCNMIILGHKHTGKSTFMRDMLYRLNELRYPRVVVFSGTDECNEFYRSIIPKAYIHGGLDLDLLQNIISAQRRICASIKEAESKLGKKLEIDPRLVIVIDDCAYKKYATKAEVFSDVFLNGRHFHVTLMMSTQYLMTVDIVCRTNVDYLICLRETIPKNRVKIWDNFFGMFARKQDFYTVLDACTTNYEALVLDNTQPNIDAEKCCKWYKAELNLPEFFFGSEQFREKAST